MSQNEQRSLHKSLSVRDDIYMTYMSLRHSHHIGILFYCNSCKVTWHKFILHGMANKELLRMKTFLNFTFRSYFIRKVNEVTKGLFLAYVIPLITVSPVFHVVNLCIP